MSKKLEDTFLLLFVVALAYHLFCYLIRWLGFWDNDYNIPWFLIIIGSIPWHLPLLDHDVETFMSNIVGQNNTKEITQLVCHKRICLKCDYRKSCFSIFSKK